MKDKLKQIQNITYFTKGHRGLLYIGDYKKKKVVIKTERKDSQAIGRVENEVNYLKILNKKGIGPNLYFHDKKFTYFVSRNAEEYHAKESLDVAQEFINTIRQLMLK